MLIRQLQLPARPTTALTGASCATRRLVVDVGEAHFSSDHHKLATPLILRIRAKLLDHSVCTLLVHTKDGGAYLYAGLKGPLMPCALVVSRFPASCFIVSLHIIRISRRKDQW
jgi:hypothetical protein